MKAQVSMEFLMTYGWAILLALGVFAAFFYLGVMDIENKLPESAMFPPPIQATQFASDADGVVRLEMKNNLGYQIDILDTGYAGTNECETITAFSSDKAIVDIDDYFVLEYTCPAAAGKRISTYLSFRYNNTFSGLVHNHTGSVVVNMI